MKDSGIEWIGEIPEGWSLIKLKYAVNCRDSERIPVDKNLRISGSYPYWGAGNIMDYINDYIFDDDLVLLGEDGAPFFDKTRDVAHHVSGKCWINNHIHVLVSKKEILTNSFLTNYLNIVDYGSYINGSILNKLTQSKMGEINICYPEIKKQNIITSFLDREDNSIDNIVSKEHLLIEKLKEYRQALITEAVTKGLNRDAKMKDSGVEWIGEIPEHWEVSKLRYIGICQNGISKSGDAFGSGTPFVSYSDVYKNMVLPDTITGLVTVTDKEKEYYSVKSGDIFFTRTSETIEEIGFTSVCVKSIPEATFAGFLIRVRPKNDIIIPEFAKYYFRSSIHRKYFVKEMNLVTRASLSQELLKSLPVLLPNKSEQQSIAEYLDRKCAAIDKVIRQKEDIIGKLEEYKKSLIYECVTGKKEVLV